ncbi:MAG: TRAP transporter substrate-binding protein [Alphaproteobacteria bacterium]
MAIPSFRRRSIHGGSRGRLVAALSVLLAAGAALFPVTPAAAAEKTLTLISSFPLDGPAGDKMHVVKLFIERFNKKATGKARIRVVGGPEIVAPFDQLKALQTGQFDMMVATSLYFNELRDLQFFHYLPFDEHIRTARQAAPLLQKISREKADVVFLQYSSPGLSFYLWTKNRPIAKPDDARGQKIRTFGDTTAPLVRHLGIVPTSIASNEVYSALRTGLLDGALRDPLSIDLLNEGELLKFATEANVADIETETYVSAKSWDALPEDVRQMLNETARETEVEGFAWMKNRVAAAMDKMKTRYGVQVVPSSPELKTVLNQTIPKEILGGLVGNSKYKDEIIEKFELKSAVN